MTNNFTGEIPDELTILIVDDDSVVRLLLEETLATKYKVLVAENGVQAWDIITSRHEEIDVVLTDMHMPLLSGMDLLRRIRSDYSDICVIVLSGTSDISQAVQAIRKGAHDYIAKPFTSLEELEIIIWRWFQQQSIENKVAQYALLHKEMMRNMKSRTFLAMDVVKSRQLKKDEDPFLVQYSFAAYHNFVAEIVDQHNGKIHGTAGDGIMTCFVQPAEAMAAGRQILLELDGFNASGNRLANDFVLRLGMHTGSVIVERNGRINEMFSETLDIAGHIQKSAAPNSIALSEVSQEELQDIDNLTLTEETVDGLQVFSYLPL